MRVDTSLLQGITAANQANQTSTASLKSTGTTTSFSSQLKAATEKETTRAVPGTNYAEILTGPRAGLYLNTSGGARDGQAFVLVKHDGREDHIYGTGTDRKVVTVSGGGSESDGQSSSATDTDTNVKTSTPTGSAPATDKTSTSDKASTSEKAPANEKTKAVAGHAYADIISGPRKDLYINTSGNARDGKTFVLVKKDDREYHIYGTGANREVYAVKNAAADTSASTSASTDQTANASTVGSATSV
jgi:hypothetical protein